MGRNSTQIGRIGRIKADQIPDIQEKSALSAQSAPSACCFAAEYPVRLDVLALFYIDLSSFCAETTICHPSRAAAAIWSTMEIATNIVEHGYPHPDLDAIFHVKATIYTDHLEIVLRERGLVFDCARLSQAALPSDWQTHQRGGLGLSLARRAVDELSYAREDGVNVWKIVVRGA